MSRHFCRVTVPAKASSASSLCSAPPWLHYHAAQRRPDLCQIVLVVHADPIALFAQEGADRCATFRPAVAATPQRATSVDPTTSDGPRGPRRRPYRHALLGWLAPERHVRKPLRLQDAHVAHVRQRALRPRPLAPLGRRSLRSGYSMAHRVRARVGSRFVLPFPKGPNTSDKLRSGARVRHGPARA